ncbi:MAG TPA: ABC transporter permease [Phaeodactylibacter sp.]|nr:ABC transporter permease [Phaeodactylibacter sp.]
MIRLIQLEWEKFKKNNVFRTMVIAYIFLLPALIFSMESILDFIDFPLKSKSVFFEFPLIWKFMAYSGSWQAFFFFGFLGVYMVTSEFQNRTLRQNILTGLNRSAFFGGKLLFATLLSALSTLYFVVITLVLGYLKSKNVEFESATQGVTSLSFRYFLMTFSYLNFGMFLGYILRKNGLALLLYFTYIIFLEKIIRWWLQSKVLGVEDKYNLYYPMNVINDLTPLPLKEMMKQVTSFPAQYHLLEPNLAVALALLWNVLFLVIAYTRFKKMDL